MSRPHYTSAKVPVADQPHHEIMFGATSEHDGAAPNHTTPNVPTVGEPHHGIVFGGTARTPSPPAQYYSPPSSPARGEHIALKSLTTPLGQAHSRLRPPGNAITSQPIVSLKRPRQDIMYAGSACIRAPLTWPLTAFRSRALLQPHNLLSFFDTRAHSTPDSQAAEERRRLREHVQAQYTQRWVEEQRKTRNQSILS